ncbi:hypothetical protein GQR58_024199 [Nymphon striatum]|nr:hypothetical protein GQR58_024199 [Nymphon striatum]
MTHRWSVSSNGMECATSQTFQMKALMLPSAGDIFLEYVHPQRGSKVTKNVLTVNTWTSVGDHSGVSDPVPGILSDQMESTVKLIRKQFRPCWYLEKLWEVYRCCAGIIRLKKHEFRGELVFIDASGGMDTYGCRICMMLTNNAVSGLPTASQTFQMNALMLPSGGDIFLGYVLSQRGSKVTKVDAHYYKVQIHTELDVKYYVDTAISICTCVSGMNGAPCKHQFSVVKHLNESSLEGSTDA